MGGGKHAHVHRLGTRCAHRPHGAILQHAQELDLQRQRHVTDLVEKQRAAVGRLEQAGMGVGGTGEGAADVAEEFRLEQLLRDRTAVDGHERRPGASAGAVDGARQHFLAGSALAPDEDAGVRGGDHPRFLEQFRHAAAAEDDAFAPGLAAAGLVAGSGRRELQRLLDLFQQHLAVERLGEIAEDTARHRLHGVGNRPVRGQQDHRQGRSGRADLVEEGESVLARQANVADDQLRRFDGDARQPFLGRGGRRYPETPGVQAHRQQPQQIQVVVDDQDMCGVGFRNKVHRGTPGALPPAVGRTGSERSMSVRASSFSCSSLLRRWLSFNCWRSLSFWASSFKRSWY
ncbi:MAG: hypothetical protein CAPSK01_003935 [Candidatus Accumulibacter vicinus]|uniref:Uncharacterized protein n=1 Tax=Candidatus Accumulibacter vicinus TaxID=2954382 RepID=A0A084XX00_9PROT|nr:MAG: hypothetical protein CAPSK01_003935 [Candidatus Accumulibacter vicinus]